MEVIMFGRFSNAFDALLAVQEAVEAAYRNDYFEGSTTSRGSYPAVDLFRNGDDVVLTAEIPGVKKDDIKIEVKNNLFRISGERKVEYPEKASFHRVERRNLQFDRTIRLPQSVDADKIKAEYNNGVLKVYLPMAESEKPKQIKVA
jgi:HSP20 family protein